MNHTQKTGAGHLMLQVAWALQWYFALVYKHALSYRSHGVWAIAHLVQLPLCATSAAQLVIAEMQDLE